MRGPQQMKLQRDCEKFIKQIFKCFEDDPHKHRSFVNLVLKYRQGNLKVLEFQLKLVDMLKDYPELIENLNRLVPEDFKVPIEDPNLKMQEAITSSFDKLRNRPADLQNFINILKEHKEQRITNYEETYTKLDAILKDEPELRDIIKQHIKMGEPKEQEAHVEQQEIREQRSQLGATGYNRYERNFAGTRVVRERDTSRGVAQKRPNEQEAAPPAVKYVGGMTSIVSLPTAAKSELLLFQVMKSILSEEMYEEFVKCIALYVEVIISAHELFVLTQDLFPDDNYFGLFQDIINSRESARRKTTMFKPSMENNFSKNERVGSYTKLDEYYPLNKSVKHREEIANQETTKGYLSIPHGSEDYSFNLMRKNQYEEALFKCEDDRYEYDHVIRLYTKAIAWMNEILSPGMSDERARHLIDRVIQLKILQKMYAHNNELIELLRNNPKGNGKIVLERLKAKLIDLREAKETCENKIWREGQQKNFHRSLDHRSFYYKQFEKKFTNHKNFLQDALQRIQSLQKSSPEPVIKYWQVLNSFEGIEDDGCNRPTLELPEFEAACAKQVSLQKYFPVYRMLMKDHVIRTDITQILWVAILNFHANNNEKEKIKRIFKSFIVEILNFESSWKPAAYNNTEIPEEKLRAFTSRIETTIYEKAFTFFRPQERESLNEESTQATLSETISMLEELNKEPEQEDTKNNASGIKDEGKKTTSPKGNKGSESPNSSHSDSISIDSVTEREEAKEMEFLESENDLGFLPKKTKNSRVFYGTQNFLFVCRFFFTLYERFLKAYEIAHTFEVNSKTEKFTEEEKAKLSNERYQAYKWVLVHLIRANIDNTKYEDFVRSLFGKDAYLMFFIEKILNSTIKALQNMANDDMSNKCMGLYTQSIGKKNDNQGSKNMEIESKVWQEELYLSKLNNLARQNLNQIQNTRFFRFMLDRDSYMLNVNYYEVPYRDWNEDGLEAASEYLEEFTKSLTVESNPKLGLSKVFLKRNVERVQKHAGDQKVIQSSKIDYKMLPNTLKMITDSFDQSDIIIRINKRKIPPAEYFENQYERMQNFRILQKTILGSERKFKLISRPVTD